MMIDKKPFIVAGPCSIESRTQLVAVVAALSRIPQVSMIRCGVWKPRSRPGGFEGRGEVALKWLRELKDEGVTIPFCCEVAIPEHVEKALEYGMNAVWVGARTTTNPFMVHELSEAVRGTGLAVMVKNATSPDVHLWVGALERFQQVGVTDLKAVHRGFDVFKNNSYRNSPVWEIPIELRRLMPEIPILCDPSHIAGRKEPIPMLSQTAMDLGFDGLMVETHPNPKEALTDALQQITPEELNDLLEHLILRSTDSAVADEELRLLREQIDNLDMQMMQLLAARFDVSRHIARVKAKDNLAVFQPKRWDNLLQNRLDTAKRLGMDEAFVKEMFEKIHTESVRIQNKLITGEMKSTK